MSGCGVSVCGELWGWCVSGCSLVTSPCFQSNFHSEGRNASMYWE